MIDENTFSLRRLLNRCRGIRAYTTGNPVNPAYPVELILEITNYCNLACPMCPRPNMNRRLGHMDFGLFQRIIDEVAGHIELVYFSGGLGEPLMHPEFERFVRYGVGRGIRLGISTNATVMWPALSDMLLDAGPSLILFSLDGATKETHERIRVGSRFERTIANVEYFLTEKARRRLAKPYTIVQMVYMPQNAPEAEAFKAAWRRFGAVDDIRLKRYLHLQGAAWFPAEDAGPHEHLSCILPWRQLSIAWDGSLALCCRDANFANTIGSAATRSIAELWNSEVMVEQRTWLSTGGKSKISVCSQCSTVKTNLVTRLGSAVVDDLTIRKLLPTVERIALRTGLKTFEY